jgi:hypothetical protein
MSPQTEDKLVNIASILLMTLAVVGLLLPGFLLLTVSLWSILIDLVEVVFYA